MRQGDGGVVGTLMGIGGAVFVNALGCVAYLDAKGGFVTATASAFYSSANCTGTPYIDVPNGGQMPFGCVQLGLDGGGIYRAIQPIAGTSVIAGSIAGSGTACTTTTATVYGIPLELVRADAGYSMPISLTQN